MPSCAKRLGLLALGLFACGAHELPAAVDSSRAGAGGGTTTSRQLGVGAGSSGSAQPPSDPLAPGMPVYDANTQGGGSCAGTTVAQLIEQLHATHAELADIASIAPADTADGPQGLYAFLREDGSLALVFRQGSNDCLAGCIDNEYWYFETRDDCVPAQVGHYAATFDNSGGANCWALTGAPIWGRPQALDPAYDCAATNDAQVIAGSYGLHAQGSGTPCLLAGAAQTSLTIDETLTIVLSQDAGDPTQGTLIVQGTGNAAIDGVSLPAQFSRRRFSAHLEQSNLPSRCRRRSMLDLSFDFEEFGSHQLQLEEIDTPDCDQHPDDYCKGQLQLDLTRPKA
jgi:hypothetical protein